MELDVRASTLRQVEQSHRPWQLEPLGARAARVYEENAVMKLDQGHVRVAEDDDVWFQFGDLRASSRIRRHPADVPCNRRSLDFGRSAVPGGRPSSTFPSTASTWRPVSAASLLSRESADSLLFRFQSPTSPACRMQPLAPRRTSTAPSSSSPCVSATSPTTWEELPPATGVLMPSSSVRPGTNAPLVPPAPPRPLHVVRVAARGAAQLLHVGGQRRHLRVRGRPLVALDRAVDVVRRRAEDQQHSSSYSDLEPKGRLHRSCVMPLSSGSGRRRATWRSDGPLLASPRPAILRIIDAEGKHSGRDHGAAA